MLSKRRGEDWKVQEDFGLYVTWEHKIFVQSNLQMFGPETI